MEEKEALELADNFPNWVGDTFRESAKGSKETIRWFIKTLYGKGYEIKKEGNQ